MNHIENCKCDEESAGPNHYQDPRCKINLIEAQIRSKQKEIDDIRRKFCTCGRNVSDSHWADCPLSTFFK